MLTYSDAIVFGFAFLIIAEVILVIKKIPLIKNILVATFILYITLVFCFTLFPIMYQETGFDYDYNFIPFKSIINSLSDKTIYSIKTLVGNLIVLAPFGYVLPLIYKKGSLKIISAIVIFAFTIEAMQYLIGVGIGYRYRCVDIDDFILNTLGGIAGYLMYKVTPKKITNIFN